MHKLSIRDVWREHVLTSINWNKLKAQSPWDDSSSMGLYLDLFFGGKLLHETSDDKLICRGCVFVQSSEPTPACKCHLGVVEAFCEGSTGLFRRARRTLSDNSCVITI